MRLASDPVTVTARHGDTGDEHEVLIAHIVMDAAEDEGYAGGWYWRPQDAVGDDRNLDAWRESVHAERGPHRNAANAISSIGHWSQAAADLAARLGEAAELIRSGDLPPDTHTVNDWLEEAERMDRATHERHNNAGPETRTAEDVEREHRPADAAVRPAGDPK